MSSVNALLGSFTLKWAMIRLFPANIHGDELILVPYSRSVGDDSVKVAYLHAAGLLFCNLPPWNLKCYWAVAAVVCTPTVSFPYKGGFRRRVNTRGNALLSLPTSLIDPQTHAQHLPLYAHGSPIRHPRC